jgi:pimeloyl-ACP methyl ester carboxylesterase
MAVVFVSGNPESSAIWDPLIAEVNPDDVLRLSPPGFGAPVPEGFSCTVEGYHSWLIAELERLDEPADLVGHDVGGSTVLTVAMVRPDLLSTWVSDSAGVFDAEYVWHDLAQTWQTPGAGRHRCLRIISTRSPASPRPPSSRSAASARHTA